MAKFSFDPKTLGFTASEENADMCSPEKHAAFKPVVIIRPGIEAIMEGLRLTNIKGLPPSSAGNATDDVDP
jgi:hypothetical protein